MNYQVKPLSFPQINWAEFIKMSREVLGASITKKLDDLGIQLERPEAFLGCLNPNLNLYENIKTSNSTHRHVFVQFLADIDLEGITELITNIGLSYYSIQGKKRWLVIMTGNITDWHLAVIEGTSDKRTLELRLMFNAIYEYFRTCGFKDLWNHVVHNPDGSFSVGE